MDEEKITVEEAFDLIMQGVTALGWRVFTHADSESKDDESVGGLVIGTTSFVRGFYPGIDSGQKEDMN